MASKFSYHRHSVTSCSRLNKFLTRLFPPSGAAKPASTNTASTLLSGIMNNQQQFSPYTPRGRGRGSRGGRGRGRGRGSSISTLSSPATTTIMRQRTPGGVTTVQVQGLSDCLICLSCLGCCFVFCFSNWSS